MWYSFGSLKEFDQREFMDTDLGELSGLTETGFVYEPDDCQIKSMYNDCEIFWELEQDDDSCMVNYKENQCKVQVFLHGDDQSIEDVGQNVVRYSGLLNYAAVNKMVVLFP
jgi:hypothetical protein